MTTLMTLGYDPQRQRYVGTWIGSLVPHLWVYDGALDATGTALTLDTEGPAMAGEGQTVRCQDVITLEPDGQRALTTRILGDDGERRWAMTVRYRRAA